MKEVVGIRFKKAWNMVQSSRKILLWLKKLLLRP